MDNYASMLEEGFKTKQDREGIYKTRIICYYNLGIEHEFLSQLVPAREAFEKAYQLAQRLSEGCSFIKGIIKERFHSGVIELEKLVMFSLLKIKNKIKNVNECIILFLTIFLGLEDI
jgi:hypothetical protein